MVDPFDVRPFVVAEQQPFVEDLCEWLAIPSISADPAHAPDVRRSAEWLAAALRRAGWPTVELWSPPGSANHSAVYAEWPSGDPAAPVVLVYGHHDVQPVDPLEQWQHPPFEPTVADGVLYARGSADDKGQVLMHVLGLRAHLAATGRDSPAVTVKLLVEGEEEVGSEHFRALVDARRDRLHCDVAVVSDTPMFAAGTPTLCLGMRGLVYAQLDLHGPDVDLHSGSFGGAVPNPVTVLTRVLAGLHDDAGRVTLPGFYDRVVPLTDRERALFAQLPFGEAEWLQTAASRATAGEAGFSTLERVWARPTCEVNGIIGGYTGPGQKTIIPTDASAKVSFRLVADQRPEEVEAAFERYVRAAVPDGIEVRLEFFGGVRPCLTPLDAPQVQAAVRAVAAAFDLGDAGEVGYTREGGSGPEADLADALGVPVVFLGVGLPDDRIHAPNERVRLDQLLRGAEAVAHLWRELAEAGRAQRAGVG